LSSIPANATVSNATLKLQATQIAGALTIDAYEVLEIWIEGTDNGAPGAASWNNRMTATSWTTAGGTFNSTAVDTLIRNSTGHDTQRDSDCDADTHRDGNTHADGDAVTLSTSSNRSRSHHRGVPVLASPRGRMFSGVSPFGGIARLSTALAFLHGPAARPRRHRDTGRARPKGMRHA
jgi:hypothetical protein